MNVENSVGYVLWPKFPEDPELKVRCMCERELHAYLTGQAEPSEAAYAAAITQMRESIKDMVLRLKERRISQVRLGISWAEAETSGGLQWIEWYLQRFAEAGFTILPCICYTPKSYAAAYLRTRAAQETDLQLLEQIRAVEHADAWTNIPPEPLTAFGRFVDSLIAFAQQLGISFPWIELWNEPNIDTDWHPTLASVPQFVEMLAHAAAVVHAHGSRVLMGGLSGVKLGWLDAACRSGLLEHVDAIGLHGLRGTWSDKVVRPSWQDRIDSLHAVMARFGEPVPVWITEVGFSTIDFREGGDRLDEQTLEMVQVAVFAEALEAVASGASPRMYWYAESDWIGESIRKRTTQWEDIIQYFFGDITVGGRKKLLYRLLKQGGPASVQAFVREHQLEHLAQTIIDRGNPKDWEQRTPSIIQAYLQREYLKIAA